MPEPRVTAEMKLQPLAVFLPLSLSLFLPDAVEGQGALCVNKDVTIDGECTSSGGCQAFYPHSYYPNNVTADPTSAASHLLQYKPLWEETVSTP